jgi:hypothetical protein
MQKQRDIVDSFREEGTKEKIAMTKRIRVVYKMVEGNQAFGDFEKELRFLQSMGAFHDCPVGPNPGSLESRCASYTSTAVHRELLECVADAVREHWMGVIKASPRFSVIMDETADVAGHSQNAMAAKIVLPNGKVAVPLLGLHDMKRTTAAHLFNAIVYQLEGRDGHSREELQVLLNDATFDTCNVMHGSHSGVAVRLEQAYAGITGRKCGSHKHALAAKHGLDDVPYIKNYIMPLVEMMGVQIAASPKKRAFFAEENELNGTSTSPPERSSATRWESRANEVQKYADPPDYHTTHGVFLRAAIGGDDLNYQEHSGRMDITSGGIAERLGHRGTFAVLQCLSAVLPNLAQAGKRLQTWDLDHEVYRAAVAAAVTHLEGCLADPEQFAPDMYNWKTRAEELEVLGLELKKTRGRTDPWIDKQIKMLLEALVLEHEKYFKNDELLVSLSNLFDINALGVSDLNTTSGNRAFEAHYEHDLDAVVERYGNGEFAFLSKDELQKEWDGFIKPYLKDARDFQDKWLRRKNAELKAAWESTRLKEQKKNVPVAKQTKLQQLSRAPMLLIVGDAYVKLAALQGSEDAKPQVLMMMATWMTLMFSQAPVESVFSQLKLLKTELRHAMDQRHLEMALTTLINGPNSWNGRQAGFTMESMVERAYQIWVERSSRKIAVERARAAGEAAFGETQDALATIPVQHCRYTWGKGFEVTDQFLRDETEADAQAAANHRRRAKDNTLKLDEVWTLESGNLKVLRTVVEDLDEMCVSIGDEVVCTGWEGTAWYTGTVFGQEQKGKKVEWVVYFGFDHTHVRLELNPKRYGRGKKIITKPGDPDKFEAGWMFVLPKDHDENESENPAVENGGIKYISLDTH